MQGEGGNLLINVELMDDPCLWRWEIRGGGALLRCGTASTRRAAEREVHEVVQP